jgi:hypothetical protein
MAVAAPRPRPAAGGALPAHRAAPLREQPAGRALAATTPRVDGLTRHRRAQPFTSRAHRVERLRAGLGAGLDRLGRARHHAWPAAVTDHERTAGGASERAVDGAADGERGSNAAAAGTGAGQIAIAPLDLTGDALVGQDTGTAAAGSPAPHHADAGRPASPRPTLPRPLLRAAACVGVMSRPVTTRRAVVRGTWFPGDRATLADLEARGVYARFVIGRPAPSGGASGADQPDPAAATEAALAAEAAAHGDIMRVTSLEAYDSLLLKVLAYYRVALRSVNASFYVKTDDDVYARLDRVPALSAQWAADGAGYVGCLFLGGEMFRDPASAYYEPFGALIAGRKYFGYMSGGFYAASHRAAGWLAARPDDQVRPLGCTDDCSIGLQMLGLPVRVVEDWRVCTYGCQPTSVGELFFSFGVCLWANGARQRRGRRR